MYITNNIKLILLIFALFIYKTPLCGQLNLLKGQFWASGFKKSDTPPSQSSFETTLGYIPTLSLTRDVSGFSFVDFEWAFRFSQNYSGSTPTSSYKKNFVVVWPKQTSMAT